MKKYLCFVVLLLIGCSKNEPVKVFKGDLKSGTCYMIGKDQAIKVVGVSEGRYYFKHSWNNQDKVFSGGVEFFYGDEIPCGKDGYEFEVLAFSVNDAKRDIEYLEKLTESLKRKTK